VVVTPLYRWRWKKSSGAESAPSVWYRLRDRHHWPPKWPPRHRHPKGPKKPSLQDEWKKNAAQELEANADCAGRAPSVPNSGA